MKKIFSIFMALLMSLVLAVPAFANEGSMAMTTMEIQSKVPNLRFDYFNNFDEISYSQLSPKETVNLGFLEVGPHSTAYTQSSYYFTEGTPVNIDISWRQTEAGMQYVGLYDPATNNLWVMYNGSDGTMNATRPAPLTGNFRIGFVNSSPTYWVTLKGTVNW